MATLAAEPKQGSTGQKQALKDCWPLNPSGPLPIDIIEPDTVRAALLETLPARRRWPTSAVRHGLKRAAKRLRLPVERPRASDEDPQLARDRALAIAFADTAAGRAALPSVEVFLEDRDRTRRRGQWCYELRNNLSEILWDRYLLNSEHEALTKWATRIAVERPDLDARGYFLTSDILTEALAEAPLPVDTNAPELAATLLLFAAKLPATESVALLRRSAELGVPAFAELLSDETKHEASEQRARLQPEDQRQSPADTIAPVAPADTRPRLTVTERALLTTPDLPDVRSAVLYVIDDVRRLGSKWRGVEADASVATPSLSVYKLAALPDVDYADFLSNLQEIRDARRLYLDAVDAMRLQVQKSLDRVVGQAKLSAPEHLVTLIADASVESLSGIWVLLDGVEQVLPADLTATEQTLLARMVDSAADFAALAEEARRLPAIRAQLAAVSAAEHVFVTETRTFLLESSSRVAAEWLKGLTSEEVECLCRGLGNDWPLQQSLLLRLGIDTGPNFIAYCERRLSSESDVERRRLEMTYFDLSSAAFDQHPALQRIVAAEHLRDLIQFGPLAAITDPTTRLADADLVGTPAAELVELIVRHLDLVGAGAELKRLARPRQRADDSAEISLLAFASTSLGTGNIYYQLKETAREHFFQPIISNGHIAQAEALKLAHTFNSDDALHFAVETVRTAATKTIRIEKRHEMQLERYLRTGSDLLEAYAAAVRPETQGRRREFRRELEQHMQALSAGPNPIGDKVWLEQQMLEILRADKTVSRNPTLAGSAAPLGEQAWSEADSLRAQDVLLLPEFYQGIPLSRLEVLALGLRDWAAEEKRQTKDVVTALLERGAYRAAVSLAEDLPSSERDREVCRAAVREAIENAGKPLREELATLEVRFGQTAVAASTAMGDLDVALHDGNLADAKTCLELIEFELAEAEEAASAKTSFDPAATELFRLLLKAGVEGVGADWSADDLRARWNTELQQRSQERSHLRLVERVLEPAFSKASLESDLQTLSTQLENPDLWLPPERARELVSLIEAGSEKLRTWIESSSAFEAKARLALTDLVRWFPRFVIEQSMALKAVADGDIVDHVLEQALEASDCIEQSADPSACVQALVNIGEIEDPSAEGGSADLPLAPLVAHPSPTHLHSPELGQLVESMDWTGLAAACRVSRATTDQDEARKLDDLADFAATMIAINDHDVASAAPNLTAAARLLGAGGQLISRALPLKSQLDVAATLVAAAIACDRSPPGPLARTAADGSWGPLFTRRGEMMSIFDGSSPAAKVLEALSAGALGRDIIDAVWEAPTKTSEPGTPRAAFLTFLHERRLDDHILALAHRHDPGIRPRLGQLLELRAVAATRPDLIPMGQAVAEQVAGAARTVPFRSFVSNLPSAGTALDADLFVETDQDIVLRFEQGKAAEVAIAVSVQPRGMVPERLEFSLFPEDDVTFADSSRRLTVTDQPVYMSREWSVKIAFGDSWRVAAKDSFRLRASAKLLTGELVNRDVVCPLMLVGRESSGLKRIDNETLIESYPGVESTPAQDDAFIGRFEEIEQLTDALITARRPSPVLLTGMRRIGKTSLLYAFHEKNRRLVANGTVTVYLTIAEKRAALMAPDRDVGSVILQTIVHALGKRRFGLNDHNRYVGEKLQQHFRDERDAVRNALADLRDPESLSDSLTLMSEQLLQWLGGLSRIVYLIDEAEALVLPYREGGAKRLELEQFLHGLREVSQTSPSVGILLSGSNHIAEFAKSYKNAFFGSSRQIELGGIFDHDLASRMVAPNAVEPYVRFDREAVGHAIRMCAGMPQFLWQVGAAATALVRSGPVTRSDVRRGVTAIVADRVSELPFKAYDVLEPVEHMLGLQGEREQDLLWLLLWRVANASSLVADEAQQHFIIDQSLLELDDPEAWKQRLINLVDLSILEMPRQAMYRFKVPIFAEGFRAPRQRQNYNLRHQRAGS